MMPRDVQGIRGWLLVIAVVLALYAARTTFYLFTLASAVQHASEFSWTVGALYEVVANIVLLLCVFSLLVLLLRKHRLFPPFAAAFFIALVLFSIADLALALQSRELAEQVRLPWRTAILLVGGCAVAVLYLLRSGRVRATFNR
jgi:hypothetical protein